MSEREEPTDHDDDRAEEAEPVSLRDLEMIFAPGKPPPIRREGSNGASGEGAEAKREAPKPPKPPRKAAAPPDIGTGDLAAFAAMGSIPPAAPAPSEASSSSGKEPSSAEAATLAPSTSEAARAEPTNGASSTEPARALKRSEVATEPPPSEGKRRARVVPKLRKPLAIPFDTPKPPAVSTSTAKSDWDTPPSDRLQDLREIAQSHPPPPRDSRLDPDDVLGLRNDALDLALHAPHVPPDLASMVDPGNSGKVHDHAAPPRPKNRSNSDTVASAVTAPPGEPSKKKKGKKGPASKRNPKTGSLAPEAAERPSKAPITVSRPPAAAPAKEERSSRTALYALLAAALLAGGYFLLRSPSAPNEPPKREQAAAPAPAPEPVKTEQAKPAADTPPPAPTATEEASAAPVASTSARPLFGKMPTAAETAAPTPSVASTGAAPSTPPAPSAKPPESGGGFDRAAATAALGGAVGQASGCKADGDPSGVAHVQVTFAPSGRVTVANVQGPPFAGTATGGCIARAFKTASVPPFDGDPVTVSKTVQIP